MKLPKKYGDFSSLEDLFALINGNDEIIIAEGEYSGDQSRPGPHIMLTSVNSNVVYDFIKQKDGSYILTVKKG